MAAEECNYRGIDGQWKEQFMHRLNGNDMLAEIIRDFTKAEESTAVASEQELV